MRFGRVLAATVAALLMVWMGSRDARSTPAITLEGDGSIRIAERKLRCSGVRNVLDDRLRNLGVSLPDVNLLVMNPTLVARQPGSVGLFVFYHECGHHRVGASELGADCWAVGRGVREGWLDRSGLREICESFGNAPATPTHPSGAERCSNLNRCFATAADSAR
jgi:hypothetical protein